MEKIANVTKAALIGLADGGRLYKAYWAVIGLLGDMERRAVEAGRDYWDDEQYLRLKETEGELEDELVRRMDAEREAAERLEKDNKEHCAVGSAEGEA